MKYSKKMVAVSYDENGNVRDVCVVKNVSEEELESLLNEKRNSDYLKEKQINELNERIKLLENRLVGLLNEIKILKGEE